MGTVTPQPLRLDEHHCEGSGPIDCYTFSMNSLKACTWNVEGLSELKVLQVCTYMADHSIGVCCIQETRNINADYYYTSDGFLVVLSGCTGSTHDFAGVGFVVAPTLVRNVVGFDQHSSRMASLKLRVQDGVAVLFSVYAPHNMKDLASRMNFYDCLHELYHKTSVNGPVLIFGDLNARLGTRHPGEDEVMGAHGYGREISSKVEVPN